MRKVPFFGRTELFGGLDFSMFVDIFWKFLGIILVELDDVG